MEALYEETELEQLSSEVFTLPSILIDQSAAVAAAERMYSNHRAGVRFYSDFRRVISVAEMMAMNPAVQVCDAAEDSGDLLDDDNDDLESAEA